jgi:hypothetical protein
VYNKNMNVVMIVPTGIGAEIGGHAGDANPAAKLLASCCDNLITHPNVLNASDINEMTENTWYVEGSILDRFLNGSINLIRPHYNRILLAVNELKNEIINGASAARATVGADVEIMVLKTPLFMQASLSPESGISTGRVEGWKELVEQTELYDFDALAIASPITIDIKLAEWYMKRGGVNPWGGVEAIASKLVANVLNKPVAHAPQGHTLDKWDDVADPRVAAETVSVNYIHCVLKGLHRAPRVVKTGGLSVDDIDIMVSPAGCWGPPHKACADRDIPIIVVEENRTCLKNPTLFNTIHVENYLEAAGCIQAMKAGVSFESVRRPLRKTSILGGNYG